MRKIISFFCIICLFYILFLKSDYISAQPILRGSNWKYNDSGVFPGSTWKDTGFNDSLWNSGNALLGYGNITAENVITTISYGSNSNNKYPAYYFRKVFNYTFNGNETNFEVNALIDDGAVFYINGIEVKRLSMPAGTISYNTLASTDGNESSYQQFFIPITFFQNGLNTIAVEVHQSSLSSSDIGFNMDLIARFSTSATTSTINQIHFGSVNTPLDGLTITWRNTGLNDSIKWGYNIDYLSGKYAGIKRNNYSGFLYDFAFPALIKDTVIHYSLWDSYSNIWTQDKVFNTAKITDANHFTFNALGDSRTNVNDWNTVSNAVRQSDFVLFGGDMVNSGGSTSDWDAWFTNGVNFFENNIVYYNTGNHDINSDATASKFRNIMVQPPNPGNELYYSFTFGNAVFICLNSNDTSNINQYNWLLNTLENNKSKKWRFVFFHKPFFTSPSHVGEMNPCLNTWWKAFDDYGVEVIFNGHTHNYQRSKPINRNISVNSAVAQYGNCTNSGRCQIVAGSAGAPRVSAGTGWFIEKSMDVLHYVNVKVAGDSLIFNTYNINNQVVDSFIIYKSMDIQINTNKTTLCDNDTLIIQLKASGGSGDILNWNKDSLNGQYLSSDTELTFPLSDSNDSYFVSRNTAGITTYSANVFITTDTITYDSSTYYKIINALITNSCGDTISKTFDIIIKNKPDSLAAITGNTEVCKGQNQIYTVSSNANASFYEWTLPNGIKKELADNYIDVFYDSTAVSGNLTVKALNLCGESNTVALNINLKNAPATAGIIYGADTVNQGESNKLYAIDPIFDADSYIWTLPNNVLGNSDSNSIVLSFPDSSISGNLTVKAQNICGSGEPNSKYINIFKTLQIKLFLEGLYAGNQLMNTATNEFGNPQWGAGNADKITIELRDSAQNYLLIFSDTNVMLKTDGNAFTSKIAALNNGKYYIVAKHRNHIETWSAAPVTFAADTTYYNFTTSADKAFGNNLKLIDNMNIINSPTFKTSNNISELKSISYNPQRFSIILFPEPDNIHLKVIVIDKVLNKTYQTTVIKTDYLD